MLDCFAEIWLVISDKDLVVVLAHGNYEDYFEDYEGKSCQEDRRDDVCGIIGVDYVQDAVHEREDCSAVLECCDEFLESFAETGLALEL